MPGRKIRFDPVAKSYQRSTRASNVSRDSQAQSYWPVMSKRLLPDQRDVGVGRTRNFDLIERSTARENPPENLFYFRFTAARVEQRDLRRCGSPCSRQDWTHQKCQLVCLDVGNDSLRLT